MQALLVLFEAISEHGKIYPYLRQVADDRRWFDSLILEGNAQPLHKALYEDLALDRVADTSILGLEF
jgi:hypothetical protein